MDTKIQFQKKATVLAADGQQIGSIERVVVNTSSNVLTDIVVRKSGLLDPEEKVVPIELVAETAQGQIVLRDTAGTLEGFPPFEERRLVDADNSRSNAEPPAVVGYPSLGVPMTVVPKEAATRTRMEQNIPDGTVAMKEGAKVIAISEDDAFATASGGTRLRLEPATGELKPAATGWRRWLS